MSISPSYLQILARLPKTRRLSEFSSGDAGVFLRHDVDHDLDLALEMAFWEREKGHRSTYFILPTAAYAADPRLVRKLVQIQELGHEVGVHLNFIASWVRKDIDSVHGALVSLLHEWRQAGLQISGCAAHGDKACYDFNFINYWIFRELRPTNPSSTETGLSPEGIPDPNPARRIAYPPNHALRRSDGSELPLWSLSMRDMGLRYHATHMPMDHYYSDSGGSWRRTASPLDADLSRGSHQILIHPEYYRGKPQRIFVASTARSGSKWLAQVAAAGTPCHSVHEFSLNHRYDSDGRLLSEKRTAGGFRSLQHRPEEARALLLHTRRYVDELDRDYLECNVYLAYFLSELKTLFPESRIVHLQRNPADVVRSVLNRDWYDTPKDERHPDFEGPEWARAGQFEKACLYVARTNERIARFADSRLDLEQAASGMEALAQFFRSLDVPFFPLLAEEAYASRVNANVRSDFPAFSEWTAEQKAAFAAICGRAPNAENPPSAHSREAVETLFDLRDGPARSRFPTKQARYDRTAAELNVSVTPGRNAYVLLGGGKWERGMPYLHGWRAHTAGYFTVQCRGKIEVGQAVVHALLYDWKGKLLRTRSICALSPSVHEASGAFRISDAACRWINFALYFPKHQASGRTCRIEDLTVQRVSITVA